MTALALELSLPEAAAARLWRHPALSGHPRPAAEAEAEEWLWLDSAGGHLAAAGQALRAPPHTAPAGGRSLHRLGPAEPLPLPGLLAPPLEEETSPAALAGHDLLPRASYAGRRHHAAPPGEAGVALALRQGRLRAGTAEAPLCRLELRGPAEAVLGLATLLARDLPLLPCARSLDEAALALAGGGPETPARRGAPDLGGVATPTDALALAIAHATGVVLAHAPLARPEAGPLAVHQMRVATRRLRSCLRLFRPLLDGPTLRELDAALRGFARALGEAREWDVFLTGLAAEISAALGTPQRPEPRWNRLLRRAEQRRLDAYARLATLLEGPEFRALVWAALRAAALPDWAPALPPGEEAPPLRHWARAVLTRRRRRLMKGAKGIASLPDAELHALRLEAKRLRYAAELFAPLWPGKPARRYLRRLSALQEALGLANDAVTARALMAGLARRAEGRPAAPGWAIGLAEGWALASGQGMRAGALAAWQRFARLDPFWEHG
ncbi:CHAD domain-containing protein [Roseomonas sp. GC11]|uniref:CYTH and CHAD domain-containing protein n=1 Tax=Roseomonas sp. GC11 TaxID=2950546 RepID=UPI002109DB0F|nr:CHAD domain-containing protein [Roseomonas sp. GC11]MCQ4161499.1 CHAD domain-containing protein [Roseomonas sp. GC11]